jgi:uncharacterized protein YndB with AHSA1/START domain
MTTPHLPNARAVADLSSGSVLAGVDIAASPERVFRALTDPRELVRWWRSPGADRTEQWTVDLRPGGRWAVRGHGADGNAFTVEGEYLTIEPQTLIVQTWRPNWEPGLVTTLTYRLEAVPGGTRLTLRHDGFRERRDACRGHAIEWERVLAWLAGHASDAGAPGAPGLVARYFNPLRIATYLLVLYCLGHTAGALFNTPHFSPAADTVLESMRTVRFPVQGFERTWFNFFFGFGLIDSVFFLVSAAIAWFLGGRSAAERRALRPVTWTLFLAYGFSIGIILQDFFTMPLVFSTLITACFGLECWRVTRASPAHG